MVSVAQGRITPQAGGRVGRSYYLANVDQPILVDADVHEGTESGHVGDDARQLHARLQILDFLHANLKREHFKLLARITARLGQFGQGLCWPTTLLRTDRRDFTLPVESRT